MKNSRRSILHSLSAKQRNTAVPEVWKPKNNFDDLSAQFAQALSNVKGEVHQAASLSEAWQLLEKLLIDLNAKRIVVADEAPMNEINVEDKFSDYEWHLVGRSDGDLRDFSASADVGITGAKVALAETGSIILYTGPGQSRVGSLLPPVHIVMLPKSKLLPDIFSWAEQRPKQMPSQMVIISGPSKTADIEQTLVVGVHGPKCFIVILYQD